MKTVFRTSRLKRRNYTWLSWAPQGYPDPNAGKMEIYKNGLLYWNRKNVEDAWMRKSGTMSRVGYLQIFRTVFYTEMEKMCQTLEWQVSRVWDHVHWIPGEILPLFYVRHLSVGHIEPELEIYKKIEQFSIPKWKKRVRHVNDTCHVSGTMSIEFLVKFYPILM